MRVSNRLLSLDILRGITIAGMILVNNPGSWNYVYAPLEHATWNGLTPTDLVFPFFMFIMGISTYISLNKYNFTPRKDTLYKILKRTSVIFLIGLGIGWLSLFCKTFHELKDQPLTTCLIDSILNFDRMRIMGVMQRLALCYGATSLIGIFIKHKYIPFLIIIALFIYFFLLFFGNGFEQNEDNIIAIVDKKILGYNHMYKDNGIFFDPEGILSTIPSICQVLIGFCCGKIILKKENISMKILQLFIIGTILTFSGFLLSYGCPINKKVWSPTFVLTTCGLASSFLALLTWLIDSKGYDRLLFFFKIFGVNPLFMYVLGGIISIFIRSIYLNYNFELINLQSFLYGIILQPNLGNYLGSLIFAFCLVFICWGIGYILYRKKILIKI